MSTWAVRVPICIATVGTFIGAAYGSSKLLARAMGASATLSCLAARSNSTLTMANAGNPMMPSTPKSSLMKGHCLVSYRILGQLNTPWPITEIAYQHHERLDGSGYPRGLSGSEILLEARILAVADVYDAMTSVRPYRSALPRDFVLGELPQMAGRLLDPDAVDACRTVALSSLADSPAGSAIAEASPRATRRQAT